MRENNTDSEEDNKVTCIAEQSQKGHTEKVTLHFMLVQI